MERRRTKLGCEYWELCTIDSWYRWQVGSAEPPARKYSKVFCDDRYITLILTHDLLSVFTTHLCLLFPFSIRLFLSLLRYGSPKVFRGQYSPLKLIRALLLLTVLSNAQHKG